MKLHIKESIKQVESGTLITDYVGDVVNLFINKPKPYRVVYNKLNDVYGIIDAYKGTHGFIYDDLIEQGYQDYDYYYRSNNSIDFVFVPYNTLNTSWDVGGFEGEWANPLFIKTGSILTKEDIKIILPDLYNKLKRSKLLLNTDLDSIIQVLNQYEKELEYLRKQEKSYLKQFENAGLKVRSDYVGIPNFEYYINTLNSMNSHNYTVMYDLRNNPILMIMSDDIFYFPNNHEDYEQAREIYWYFGDDIPLHYDLEHNLSEQSNKYELIKNLLDEAGLPYEIAYDYV